MKSEDKIQSEVFQAVWNNYPDLRRLFFHIPNGGKRDIREATKFKAIGLVAGIPDLFLSIARGKHHGFYIELKRLGGKAEPHQLKVHEKMRDQGYKVGVYDNFEECYHEIENYISNVTFSCLEDNNNNDKCKDQCRYCLEIIK